MNPTTLAAWIAAGAALVAAAVSLVGVGMQPPGSLEEASARSGGGSTSCRSSRTFFQCRLRSLQF